jgi:hypothetical protein
MVERMEQGSITIPNPKILFVDVFFGRMIQG